MPCLMKLWPLLLLLLPILLLLLLLLQLLLPSVLSHSLELRELSVLHATEKGRIKKSDPLDVDEPCAASALPRSVILAMLLAPSTGSQLRVMRGRLRRELLVGVEVVETRGSDTKSKPSLGPGSTCIEPILISLRDSDTALVVAAETTVGLATDAADAVLRPPLITVPADEGDVRIRL